MSTLFTALIFFSIIIMVHEFGHFIIGRLTGIHIEEFSIGMGPRILKFPGKETEYSIRILPIGGYVKFLGEDDRSEDPKAFINAKVWKRIFVVSAGPIMNFLLAIVLLAILFMSFGIQVPAPIVGYMETGSPSEEAGLKINDRIIEVNEIKIQGTNNEAIEQIKSIIQQNGGKTVSMKVERKKQILAISVTPRLDKNSGRYLVGVYFYENRHPGFFESIGIAIRQTGQIIVSMVEMLGKLIFQRQGLNQVMGPVGIVSEIGRAAEAGVEQLMALAIIISINLGIMNLIPFPALDGGRLTLMMVEVIRGKPIDAKKEGYFHLIGFVILIALMILVTYQDIIRR